MISHDIPNIVLVKFGSDLYSGVGANIIECGPWEREVRGMRASLTPEESGETYVEWGL